MTAAGVVRFPRAAAYLFLPADRLRLGYGSAWNVRSGLERPVSFSLFILACLLEPTLIRFRYTRICPVDTILTRMGAYDNMFSNASTFKVELDEWCGSPDRPSG